MITKPYSVLLYKLRFLVCLFLTSYYLHSEKLFAKERPNILIILADDLGYSDLSCYGGEIKTPYLDKIAENGLKYTQFYNTARCWPTRAALMTGFYPQQINRDKVLDVPGGAGNNKRPNWASLIPFYLQKVGYRTYHSGKWHIDGTPLKNGFDHSYRLKDHDRFFTPKEHYEDDRKLPTVKPETGYYSTVEIADRMIGYLEDHQEKYSEQPFFSYLAFTAPHFPLQALPEDIEKIGDRYLSGWDVVRQKRWQKMQDLGIVKGTLSEVQQQVGAPYNFRKAYEILGSEEVRYPEPWYTLTEKQKQFQIRKMMIHAAMIERMDSEIGKVFEQLKKMGKYEDTLILFLSDNGASAEIMVRGDGHDSQAIGGSSKSYLCLGPGWSTVSNTPFKRHKTWVHEGGACTPLLVHWPMGIKAKGVLRHSPGHVIDILPTIIEITGIDTPESPPIPLPGQSLLQTFDQEQTRSRTLWWSHNGHHAIREGDWKLVSVKKNPWELYNLSEDRTESNDLAKDYPEKVKLLEKIWHAQVEDFRKTKKTKQK